MSFYGEVVSTGDSPFVFDKVYSSRYHMERSMKDDDIFVGRYVLVSYDSSYTHNNFKRAYRDTRTPLDGKNIYLYSDSSCEKIIKIKSNNEGEESTALIGDIYYVIDNDTYTYYQCINYLSSNEYALFNFYKDLTFSWKEAYYKSEGTDKSNLGSGVYQLYSDENFTNLYGYKQDDEDEIGLTLGEIVYVRNYDKEISEKEKEEGIYTFYECYRFEGNIAKFQLVDTIIGKYEEGTFDNYLANQKIDYLKYGRYVDKSYDKTVWQKAYVGTKEKYIKVADLNVKTPELSISVDAPTFTPKAPYFESDIGESNIKDLHLQPTWGLRVRAANNALSQNGMLANVSSGVNTYASYMEAIKNKFSTFVDDILLAESNYQTGKSNALELFNYNKNIAENNLINYLNLENTDSELIIDRTLKEEIDNNINELFEDFFTISLPLRDYSFQNFGPMDLYYAKQELEYNKTIAHTDLLKNRNDIIEAGILDAQAITYLNNIISDFINCCKTLAFCGGAFNKKECECLHVTCYSIINYLDNTFKGINITFEDDIYPLLYNEVESIINSTKTKEEIVEEKIQSIIFYIDESILLSDEKITWQQDGYYYDGQEWKLEETTLPGDIYYNKAGFNKQYSIKSKLEDRIAIEPTGYSQYIEGGKGFNTPYADLSKDALYKATIEAPDTQELSIHLPSIGNTISDVWDIMYGTGEEDEDGNFRRKLDISWEETSDDERNRMVKVRSDNNLTYDTDSLATVSGAINSIQDLMGKIIIDDITIEDEVYTSAKEVPSDYIRDYIDQNKIYYFSEDGKYYRSTNKYTFKENCYPEDEYDSIKHLLKLETGEDAPDIYDPELTYYSKENEEKILIYHYIDTEEEYKNLVQGYTKVDEIYDPNEMPKFLYYYNNTLKEFIYKRKYQKNYNYYFLEIVENPFNPESDSGEFRRDTQGNLFMDSEYQWRGQSYYKLDDYLNANNKGFIFIPNKYYIDITEDIGASKPTYDAGSTFFFDKNKQYYALADLKANGYTEIIGSDGRPYYVIDTIPEAVPVLNITDTDHYYHYIYSLDFDIDGETTVIETSEYKIDLAPLTDVELDKDIPSYRLVINYIDKTVEDNVEEVSSPMFYAIPKAVFEYQELSEEEKEQGIENLYREPLAKYEPNLYYFSYDSGERNNTVNYKLDSSSNGSPDREYFAITAKNISPQIYQPGTIYYRQYSLPPDGRLEYILSNSAFEPDEDYYIHNTYYVTNDYDSYRTGQIWDYTLPWLDYVLDTNEYRDKTNYAGKNENWMNYDQLYTTAQLQEIPDYIYRPYYYDNQGKRLVNWREDFKVTKENQFFTLNEIYKKQTTETIIPGRIYYEDNDGQKSDIEATFYEPGKFFYLNPNKHWYIKDSGTTITNNRTYYYDKNGENEVLFKDRFNSIVNNNNIYSYNTNDNFEIVSAASPDGNTSYVYEERFNYYLDNQGDQPVYFKDLWYDYLDIDESKYDFYIPNFDKEKSLDLVKERNYYQNDLQRTKIHLSDADWLKYNNRYENYEEGYYDYRLDENNEVTMGRQYYIKSENRYIPLNFIEEQFDDYKTTLQIHETFQIPSWKLDNNSVVNINRNYYTDNIGTTPAYLWEQFERISQQKTFTTRSSHSVKRYEINNDPLNINIQYYLDEGNTKVYFVDQYPNFGNATDILEVRVLDYLHCSGAWNPETQYYIYNGSAYEEIEYFVQQFDEMAGNGSLQAWNEANSNWETLDATATYNSNLNENGGYRLSDYPNSLVYFHTYDTSTMYYKDYIWKTVNKNNPDPATYDNTLVYRLNNEEINNIIENYVQGQYYSEMTRTEYHYEPIAAGSSPDTTKTYYLNGVAVPFVNYQPNTFYYWDNAGTTVDKWVDVTSSAGNRPIEGKVYRDKNGDHVNFVSFEDLQNRSIDVYYYDNVNMQYRTLTEADINITLDITKNYYYNHNYNNRIQFNTFNSIKNDCYYYHDESQIGIDYIKQTGSPNWDIQYYVFTETGIQEANFIEITNFPGNEVYYLIDNDDANRPNKYELCNSSDEYNPGKKYFEKIGNIYSPILFQGWISNKYYYQYDNDPNRPYEIAYEPEILNNGVYALDSQGIQQIKLYNNALGLWYSNPGEATFETVESGYHEPNDLGTTIYYVELLNPEINEVDNSFIIYNSSEGENIKHYIKKIPTENEDYSINGYNYYDYTGYEDQITENFDYSFLPKVIKDNNNNNLYIEYKLEKWEANKFYYSNSYNESIKSSKLVSKDLLDRYKKYYFEELIGFSKNYNTINGLILQFNQALGNKNAESRDIETLYGAINRLNDEIRRLKIYDYSTVNNIISSIEYSFNTITRIHKQLRSLQEQAAGEGAFVLTELEAARFYPNILNMDKILGTDIAGMNRDKARVVYHVRPDGGTIEEYPQAYDERGNSLNYYWHYVGVDSQQYQGRVDEQGYEIDSVFRDSLFGITLLNTPADIDLKLFDAQRIKHGKETNNIIEQITVIDNVLDSVENNYVRNISFKETIGEDAGNLLTINEPNPYINHTLGVDYTTTGSVKTLFNKTSDAINQIAVKESNFENNINNLLYGEDITTEEKESLITLKDDKIVGILFRIKTLEGLLSKNSSFYSELSADLQRRLKDYIDNLNLTKPVGEELPSDENITVPENTETTLELVLSDSDILNKLNISVEGGIKEKIEYTKVDDEYKSTTTHTINFTIYMNPSEDVPPFNWTLIGHISGINLNKSKELTPTINSFGNEVIKLQFTPNGNVYMATNDTINASATRSYKFIVSQNITSEDYSDSPSSGSIKTILFKIHPNEDSNLKTYIGSMTGITSATIEENGSAFSAAGITMPKTPPGLIIESWVLYNKDGSEYQNITIPRAGIINRSSNKTTYDTIYKAAGEGCYFAPKFKNNGNQLPTIFTNKDGKGIKTWSYATSADETVGNWISRNSNTYSILSRANSKAKCENYYIGTGKGKDGWGKYTVQVIYGTNAKASNPGKTEAKSKPLKNFSTGDAVKTSTGVSKYQYLFFKGSNIDNEAGSWFAGKL